ncbi:hypothetical protein AGDE_03683 [Angomonas deanei]|uniref:Uncharacterized protein n=1 Tax=Angomonas deanei TaxID=59799 RepID=S9WW64_9TRYP|nr:hypothetical protein AGDE_05035 [Angomonas deanei]EPY40245.1 hypothetical protein AGDE_03683 [Angomonas deanei]CAD2212860.1 hypothetical protein, conserved [Angomonas deanei]|eukprot:EPY38894.1 hypothetical protein AGDE_05035 [Angomonas deanei]
MFHRQTIRLARQPISKFLRDPKESQTFEQTLARCNKEQIDMASGLSSEFLKLQSMLFRYRVARLADECAFVAKHPTSSFPSASMLCVHLLALPAVFWTAMCVGRFSWVPLVGPTLKEKPAVASDASAEAAKAKK